MGGGWIVFFKSCKGMESTFFYIYYYYYYTQNTQNTQNTQIYIQIYIFTKIYILLYGGDPKQHIHLQPPPPYYLASSTTFSSSSSKSAMPNAATSLVILKTCLLQVFVSFFTIQSSGIFIDLFK